MSTAHYPDGDECEEPWYQGFDDGFSGIPPESPNELYLEGYCDGAESRDEDD